MKYKTLKLVDYETLEPAVELKMLRFNKLHRSVRKGYKLELKYGSINKDSVEYFIKEVEEEFERCGGLTEHPPREFKKKFHKDYIPVNYCTLLSSVIFPYYMLTIKCKGNEVTFIFEEM